MKVDYFVSRHFLQAISLISSAALIWFESLNLFIVASKIK